MIGTYQRAALIYDFDGTLARGNLQEQTFIPEVLQMENGPFWDGVKAIAKQANVDEILIYMCEMIAKAKEQKVDVTEEMLRQHGAKAELFPGLVDGSWFRRINEHGRNCGLLVDHYIISSGIDEMIRGCPIHDEFRYIFASKFIYDGAHVRWPGVAINYTTKTQYLFRINKGIENHYDNKEINRYMSDRERPIPFKRMIFIGDGETDIPAMKMTTQQGGWAIAVYDPERSDKDLNKIHHLIADRRVDFVAPADYKKDSQMDITVRGILSRMGRDRSEGA